MTWRNRAPCRGRTRLFYDSDREDEALAICDDCPVRPDCFDYVTQLEAGRAEQYRFGVAGGMTARDRIRWWHERKKSA